MKPLLCIYHAYCDDGFGAAWAVRQAVPNAEFYEGHYQRPPPDVTGRDVVMVDFSYKRPALEHMLETANSVTVLDHHESAQRELRSLMNSKRLAGVFDMRRSGAVIAWQWFHPNKTLPPLLAYVQDRDLWHKNLPLTEHVTFGIRSFPRTFEAWDRLAAMPISDIAVIGKPVYDYMRVQVEQAKSNAHWMKFHAAGGMEMPASNAPPSLYSEVAGELCQGWKDMEHPFAAAYSRNRDGWTVSLRSQGRYNVARLAELYGGGGHADAAGFKVGSLQEV